MNSHKSKNPVEKRLPVSIWKAQEREKAMEALRIAKEQNKPVKFLINGSK